MAAQVLSGSGPVSYTNSTGQNVRLVINYFDLTGSGTDKYAAVTFGGVETKVYGGTVLGKSLSFITTNDGYGQNAAGGVSVSCPTEVALANGDTFSIAQGTLDAASNITGYNIIIIPEAG